MSWVQASNFEAGTAYATFDRHTYRRSCAPIFIARADFGKTWTPLVTAQESKASAATRTSSRKTWCKPNLLFLGTEFGLCISVDGGKAWAQFKGSRFPAVAVRDIAIHPRDNELVLGTHGRGIWIVDDITPLRALTPELLGQEAALSRRARCSSASRATAAGLMARPFSSATIRPTPR